MREYLFRGKDINGKWVYGDLLHIPEGCLIFKSNVKSGQLDVNFALAITKEEITPVFPKTVGQFTGLTDKNGVKIFEADIFSVNGKYPKVIKYQENVMAFCCANLSDLKDEDWKSIWQQPEEVWWNDFKREIEVIGNIHDNKNLLEQ